MNHEQFAWDIRTEPGVVDAFAAIWGTDDLLVSFGKQVVAGAKDAAKVRDGVNISLPMPESERDEQYQPWAHVDQSPLRRHLHCIQGIVNLVRGTASI